MSLFYFTDFYRKWLKEHPEVLDSECNKSCDNSEEDWPSILEKETPEERDKRRKEKIIVLVKHLPALLADKATNMYRQGQRNAK